MKRDAEIEVTEPSSCEIDSEPEPELERRLPAQPPKSPSMTSPPPRPRSWMRQTRRQRPSSLPARFLR